MPESTVEEFQEFILWVGNKLTKEFYERVMAYHWDMAACFCPLCYRGRYLGYAVWEKYVHDRGAKTKVAQMADVASRMFLSRTDEMRSANV